MRCAAAVAHGLSVALAMRFLWPLRISAAPNCTLRKDTVRGRSYWRRLGLAIAVAFLCRRGYIGLVALAHRGTHLMVLAADDQLRGIAAYSARATRR